MPVVPNYKHAVKQNTMLVSNSDKSPSRSSSKKKSSGGVGGTDAVFSPSLTEMLGNEN